MSDTSADDLERVHYFVDEAGTPTLFGRRRRVIVGNPGCSKYFILGKAEVADPDRPANELKGLRRELLAEPYFKGVPSMQPERAKTAVAFHAKDDCLQVVDYYLWALQRFFESDEDRFLGVIWPQTKLVYDLDDVRNNSFGEIYSAQKPLTLEARNAERKKKGRRI